MVACHVPAIFCPESTWLWATFPALMPCAYLCSVCSQDGDRLETTTSNFWIPADLSVLSQAL